MNRAEFLSALEAELQNVSADEREEALKFYREFLDEAGPDNEAAVLADLGDPHRVANIIRANLGTPAQASFGAARAHTQAAGDGPQSPDAEAGGAPSDTRSAAGTAQAAPDRRLLWILLIAVTSPLWIGAVGGLFGLAAGLIGGVAGFAVGGAGMLVKGLVGVVRAAMLLSSSPANAMLNMGIALGTAALGAAMAALGLWIAFAAVPVVFKWIGRVIRAVFGKVGPQA